MDFLAAHWLDILTTILGLAYILFEYKASRWMWLVGFLMEALGIVLYYQKGLYADCGMETYYLIMTFYGYWSWVRPEKRVQGSKVQGSKVQGSNVQSSRVQGSRTVNSKLYNMDTLGEKDRLEYERLSFFIMKRLFCLFLGGNQDI